MLWRERHPRRAISHDHARWESYHLAAEAREGRLLFVLGAGANAEQGSPTWRIPDWNGLLESLLLRALKARAVSSRHLDGHAISVLHRAFADPLTKASTIRQAFFSDDEWRKAIADSLIQIGDRSSGWPISESIRGVARILVRQVDLRRRARLAVRAQADPAQAGRAESLTLPVLTLNFDCALENALRPLTDSKDIDLLSISSEQEWSDLRAAEGNGADARDRIVVIHLRGKIEWADGPTNTHPIILDAESFDEFLPNPEQHWTWDCLRHYLTEAPWTPLFLGLSLSDSNLRTYLARRRFDSGARPGVYIAGPLHGQPLRTESAADPRDVLSRQLDRMRTEFEIGTWQSSYLRSLMLFPFRMKSWKELPWLLDYLEARIGA